MLHVNKTFNSNLICWSLRHHDDNNGHLILFSKLKSKQWTNPKLFYTVNNIDTTSDGRLEG